MSRVVTSFDPLLGKRYNSLGLSNSQDDVEVCCRRMETSDRFLKYLTVYYYYYYYCYLFIYLLFQRSIRVDIELVIT